MPIVVIGIRPARQYSTFRLLGNSDYGLQNTFFNPQNTVQNVDSKRSTLLLPQTIHLTAVKTILKVIIISVDLSKP